MMYVYWRTKKIYIFDIDWESVDIVNIQRYYGTGWGQEMEDLHTGLEDLEYDRDVPEDYGKGE